MIIFNRLDYKFFRIKPSNLQTFKPSNLQTFKPSNLQTFKPSTKTPNATYRWYNVSYTPTFSARG